MNGPEDEVGGGLVALVSLVVAVVALMGVMMAAPRLSRAGETPRGGTRPNLSPEPLPRIAR